MSTPPQLLSGRVIIYGGTFGLPSCLMFAIGVLALLIWRGGAITGPNVHLEGRLC